MSADHYDIEKIRAHFPALTAGAAHFDGPGGSQVPDVVADAVRDAMVSPMANRGRVTAAERTADDITLGARAALADLLNAEPGGVIFGRSMTQLTYDLSRALAKDWAAGDEVVVTRLDHDANVRPWVQAAEAAGATVRWIDFDPETAELTTEHVAAVLSERTRLVAVTGASNLLGTRPPLAEIAEAVHQTKALFFVDGVHLTAHHPVDVLALGADFFACSPYKFLGPHCGVLVAKPELLETVHPDKLLPATDDVPERFELGTLPYELLAGCTATVEFLSNLASSAESRRERIVESMTAVAEHEDRLREKVEAGLAELPGVTLRSKAADRTPTLLITFDGKEARDAHVFLADLNINAPAGSFYAIEPARRMKLEAGGLRIGFAPYTNDEDIDRLLAGLARFTEQ